MWKIAEAMFAASLIVFAMAVAVMLLPGAR